ncbi:glycosyltransferase family 2 protein [Oleidesulfovibrio sp.]|uniref:glycosyltransferase family 2 protein n=1 Tax=Oleidesulfovibrio sp. TaxID=2909707 RepID=UPI003A8B5FD7
MTSRYSTDRNSPFFSVIIPTYNRRQFLCDAIDSVLEQTFVDFELIVADDGSTDGTYEMICSSYDDPRLRILRLQNSGASAARNAAMQESCGRWLAFLDSDDTWLPQKLQHAAEFIADDRGDFLYTGVAPSTDSAQQDYSQNEITARSAKEYLFSGFAIKTSTVVVRRDSIANPAAEFGVQKTCGDYVFFWKALCLCERVAFMPYRDTVIRVSGDNLTLSHNPSAMLADELKAIDAVSAWFVEHALCTGYRLKLADLRYWQVRSLLAACLLFGQFGSFVRHTGAALRCYGLGKGCGLVARAVYLTFFAGQRRWLKGYGRRQYGS